MDIIFTPKNCILPDKKIYFFLIGKKSRKVFKRREKKLKKKREKASKIMHIIFAPKISLY